jgi:hypothetical protein
MTTASFSHQGVDNRSRPTTRWSRRSLSLGYGPPHRRQRRGGALIHYGAAQSLSHFLFLVLKLVIYNLLPNGKAIKGYGTIVVTSR